MMFRGREWQFDGHTGVDSLQYCTIGRLFTFVGLVGLFKRWYLLSGGLRPVFMSDPCGGGTASRVVTVFIVRARYVGCGNGGCHSGCEC